VTSVRNSPVTPNDGFRTEHTERTEETTKEEGREPFDSRPVNFSVRGTLGLRRHFGRSGGFARASGVAFLHRGAAAEADLAVVLDADALDPDHVALADDVLGLLHAEIRELADVEKRAREDLIKDLLPVFDNLERATAHAETATDVKALSDGIGLVMRQFLDTLSKIGIERIKAQGEPFDPAFHEAVQQFETTEHPPGTVMHEVQAGYKQGDKLVRPAIVVVAKAPPN